MTDKKQGNRRRILLWPRDDKFKTSEEKKIEGGFVVGWRTTTRRTLSTPTTPPSDVFVVAGIIDPKEHTLAHYLRRFDSLREQYDHHGICGCLVDDLEILATWNASDQYEYDAQTTENDIILTRYGLHEDHSLESMDDGRGFPWWSEDNFLGANQEIVHQLVFYNRSTSYTNVQSSDLNFRFEEKTAGSFEFSSQDWLKVLERIDSADVLYHQCVANGMGSDMTTRMLVGASSPNHPASKLNADDDTTWNVHRSKYYQQSRRLSKQHKKLGLFGSMAYFHFRELICSDSCHHPNHHLCCWLKMTSFGRFFFFQRASDKSENNCQYDRKMKCFRCNQFIQRRRSLRTGGYSGQEQIMRWRSKNFLDITGGLIVGILLLWASAPQDLYTAKYLNAKNATTSFFFSNLRWLESFPVGFKLNVPLTNSIGSSIRRSFLFLGRLFGSFCSTEHWIYIAWYLVAVLSILGGSSTFLALVFDIWRLQISPVAALAMGTRLAFEFELRFLSALWRLFRGKKRNILRDRVDSMDYDSMQLLVGTICFAVSIFLFTTLGVYFCTFLAWNMVLSIPLTVLSCLYNLVDPALLTFQQQRADQKASHDDLDLFACQLCLEDRTAEYSYRRRPISFPLIISEIQTIR